MIAAALYSSRPLSWINTAYPFVAAYLLVGGEINIVLIVGAVFFLVPYNLALYGINDVFDHASDVLNPRKGGVEGALVPPEIHRQIIMLAVGACLPFLVLLVAWGNTVSWLILALSMTALVAYSAPPLRFKEVPVLDSLTSSMHFVTPAAYGVALVGGPVGPQVFSALGAFLLWGMASHAFGAVQDIMPDREAGIRSVATVLGARATVRMALGLWVAAGLLAASLGWPAGLTGLLVLPYLVAVARFARLEDDDADQARAGWRYFLWINYAVGAGLTVLLILI